MLRLKRSSRVINSLAHDSQPGGGVDAEAAIPEKPLAFAKVTVSMLLERSLHKAAAKTNSSGSLSSSTVFSEANYY